MTRIPAQTHAGRTRESEAHFQRQVEQLATFYGWRHYHTHDSRRSAPGFPDLVLVRGVELIFAELKTDKGRVRPEQAEWHDALREICEAVDFATSIAEGVDVVHDQLLPRVEVHLWRPADFSSLHARLARGRHRVEPLYRPANDSAEETAA